MNNVEKFEEGNVKRLHPEEEAKDKIDQIETELANENLSDEEKQSLLEKKEFYQQLLNKIAV